MIPNTTRVSDATGPEPVLSPVMIMADAQGLHMAPAATLAATAATFRSEIRLVRGTEQINAKALIAIIKFGLKQDDAFQIQATGPDAAAAVAALYGLLSPGCTLSPPASASADAQPSSPSGTPAPLLLRAADVFLGQRAATKEAAIRHTGDYMVRAGLVEPPYIDAMLAHEALASTFLIQGLALPHGTIEGRRHVRRSGIVICQFPAGIPFGPRLDHTARLVIGIAARGKEHLPLLSRVASTLGDPGRLIRLGITEDPRDIVQTFDPATDPDRLDP